MQNFPTWIPVVAALLVREDGMVLVQKRPPGKPHAGLWEFPGGKVESEENPRVALTRELKEELSIDVDSSDLEPMLFTDALPENPVVLFLYKVTHWHGEPTPMTGAEVDWVGQIDLQSLPMPPLDVELRVGLPDGAVTR